MLNNVFCGKRNAVSHKIFLRALEESDVVALVVS